jgi:hypothetical protein
LFLGGRKKTKDKETKKKSASSEEETITKTSKKKQLKKGMWLYFISFKLNLNSLIINITQLLFTKIV